jgi:hypothetical protein
MPTYHVEWSRRIDAVDPTMAAFLASFELRSGDPQPPLVVIDPDGEKTLHRINAVGDPVPFASGEHWVIPTEFRGNTIYGKPEVYDPPPPRNWWFLLAAVAAVAYLIYGFVSLP